MEKRWDKVRNIFVKICSAIPPSRSFCWEIIYLLNSNDDKPQV